MFKHALKIHSIKILPLFGMAEMFETLEEATAFIVDISTATAVMSEGMEGQLCVNDGSERLYVSTLGLVAACSAKGPGVSWLFPKGFRNIGAPEQTIRYGSQPGERHKATQ